MSEQALLEFGEPESSRADQMFEDFVKYHQAHPEVWCLFLRMVYSEMRKGKTHYSARSILHRIRWDDLLLAGDGEFKMPHQHSPWYARMWAASHPEHADIFSYRSLPSEGKPPLGGDGEPRPHDPDQPYPTLSDAMSIRLRELAEGAS